MAKQIPIYNSAKKLSRVNRKDMVGLVANNFYCKYEDVLPLLEEKSFPSTNTASFQLPLSLESCIEHLRSMWGGVHITAEVQGAIEETHDYIERQLQTLL